MNGPFAAGGIYSNVEDMYRWNEALTKPSMLLSADSLRQMFAVYPETTAYGGQNYGYGVVLTHRFGKLLYYHGGGVDGFASAIQRYPTDRVCIVILENLDPATPWDVADHVASELFHQPLPAH
jgi:CubicO group peptidase (beta-lactamase class C family)